MSSETNQKAAIPRWPAHWGCGRMALQNEVLQGKLTRLHQISCAYFKEAIGSGPVG